MHQPMSRLSRICNSLFSHFYVMCSPLQTEKRESEEVKWLRNEEVSQTERGRFLGKKQKKKLGSEKKAKDKAEKQWRNR